MISVFSPVRFVSLEGVWRAAPRGTWIPLLNRVCYSVDEAVDEVRDLALAQVEFDAGVTPVVDYPQ